MKVSNKITIIALIVVALVLGGCNYSDVFAVLPGRPGDPIDMQDGERLGLSDIYNIGGDKTYETIAGKIIGLVQFICYAAAVIILLYKGVGLMSKAPEAKANAKKELISYAVGAFILFGIGTIVKIIGTIAMNAIKTY